MFKLFSFGMATHLREESSEFKPAVLHLDIDRVTHPAHEGGVSIHMIIYAPNTPITS